MWLMGISDRLFVCCYAVAGVFIFRVRGVLIISEVPVHLILWEIMEIFEVTMSSLTVMYGLLITRHQSNGHL